MVCVVGFLPYLHNFCVSIQQVVYIQLVSSFIATNVLANFTEFVWALEDLQTLTYHKSFLVVI